MPPKKKGGDAESKKALQKKKAKALEDKTFGLKNKNKSKKVQQYVSGLEKNIMNGGDPKQRRIEEQRKAEKAAAKARKKAMEDERNALFGEALLAVQKKSKNLKEGKVEAVGRDGNDDAKKSGTSRAMKMMYQMDAKEMEDKLKEDPNYVPTLEDEIEAKRQKLVADLKAKGQKGTPVTPESFKAWQERKRKRKAEEAKKLVEKELKKKKGKGLAVLSGRDLFEYKRELFDKDDDDGVVESEMGSDNHGSEEEKKESATSDDVGQIAEKVEQDLFLEGDDDDFDLDDLDEDD